MHSVTHATQSKLPFLLQGLQCDKCALRLQEDTDTAGDRAAAVHNYALCMLSLSQLQFCTLGAHNGL